MIATETKSFTWNPTAYSYVLSQLQFAKKTDQKTGVRRIQSRIVGVTYRTRIEATPAGFAWIQAQIAYLLAHPEFSSITTAN